MRRMSPGLLPTAMVSAMVPADGPRWWGEGERSDDSRWVDRGGIADRGSSEGDEYVCMFGWES